MGGGGGYGTGSPGSSRQTGGTMGIVMPLYTIGIVCFFIYTILKVRMIMISEQKFKKEILNSV
jgi:hypothetical protein